MNHKFLSGNPRAVKHLTNPNGRDFVVGDLHGCRSMLDTLMEAVQFDTFNDRLFSVGDLVDRGPDSEGCLSLLKEAWFYPVLGNHDAMLLAWLYGPTDDATRSRLNVYQSAFVYNGGLEWAKNFKQAGEYIPLLEKIPFIRSVGDGDHRFNVAHAELAFSVPASPLRNSERITTLQDSQVDNMSDAMWDEEHYVPGYDANGTWTDHVLWGRTLSAYVKAQLKVDSPILPQPYSNGLSKTYVGHTVIPYSETHPIMAYSHVFMDSGAFKASVHDGRYGLSLWNHTKDTGLFLNGSGEMIHLKGFM